MQFNLTIRMRVGIRVKITYMEKLTGVKGRVRLTSLCRICVTATTHELRHERSKGLCRATDRVKQAVRTGQPVSTTCVTCIARFGCAYRASAMGREPPSDRKHMVAVV